MSEIRYKSEMHWLDGVHVKCEVKEWYDSRKNEVIKSEITVSDKDYYTYQEYKRRYYDGFITKETLDLILDAEEYGKKLRRFEKQGELVISDSVSADRFKSTKEFEGKWYGLLAEKDAEKKWNGIANFIGDVFKTL